ncbi:TetR/AcrR family transcriptional regulator [Nocardioides sp. LHG3406-4]|uniref:TetR/AcrR family transcriptional regulator n=1 Tax=Nocardioides sp. LHG3406-4 TaxID=2804575 RepID=UPI003CE71DCE
MGYDSAATRARLLDAALEEFVNHGLAGARVDRISVAASANKQAIYAYFGSKDALFDAVLDDRLRDLADLVPFTPADLPGYTGVLFDQLVEDPGLVRLTQWKALERPGAAPAELSAHTDKADALAAVYGVTRETGMDALMLTLGVALAWSTTAPEIRHVDGGPERRRRLRHRAAVVAAAEAITAAVLGRAPHPA